MAWRAMSVVVLLIALSPVGAQQSRPANDWKDFDFLLGEWTWMGGGQPGQAKGTSTVRAELNGTVLVRRTHLDYPATKDRAAFVHDDLLYFYHDPSDGGVRAIFFDGEGHVIRYSLSVPHGEDALQFVSDAAPAGTRCRMTYSRTGADSVSEKFEIAPPGKPDEFATYVEFSAKKVGK